MMAPANRLRPNHALPGVQDRARSDLTESGRVTEPVVPGHAR